MLTAHDAALLIGDPALKIDRSRYLTHDLAEEWMKLTGRPFVFAFWAVRREALTGAVRRLDLHGLFQQSRDHGLDPANVNHIAHEWAPRLGLSEEMVRDYLTQQYSLFLDAQCLGGCGFSISTRRSAERCREPPACSFWKLPKQRLVDDASTLFAASRAVADFRKALDRKERKVVRKEREDNPTRFRPGWHRVRCPLESSKYVSDQTTGPRPLSLR